MKIAFVPAKWFKPAAGRALRVVVMHAMQYPERLDAAEIIAKDFNTRPPNNKASAHVCVDADSIVRCVYDYDVAYAAPGANSDGFQVELAGYAGQTREQWLDAYGVKLLALAADEVARVCKQYAIPAEHISDADLQSGKKGIVGHDQVTRVYKQSDHTDPGPDFPWDYFVDLVAERVRQL